MSYNNKGNINIALFSHSKHACGAEKMLLNLAIILQQTENYNPILFIKDMHDGDLFLEARKNQIMCVNITKSQWYVLTEPTLFENFAQYSFDVISEIEEISKLLIDNNIGMLINNTLTTIAPILCSVRLNIPSVTWIHGILDGYLLPTKNYENRLLTDRSIIEMSTISLCCSKWTEEYYRRVCNNDVPIEVLNNWTLKPAEIIPMPSNITFVCLNTFDHNKGVDILIYAAKILKDRGYNFSVELYGAGGEEIKLRDIVNRNELNETVTFRGRTNDVQNVYNRCYALINPSYIESFGLTIIEAMAHKRPVIASKSGGPEGIIDDGINGFLVEKMDIIELADKMAYLINNNDEAIKMGEKGYEKYCKEFSTSRAYENITSILERVSKNFCGYNSQQLFIYQILCNNLFISAKGISNDFNSLITPDKPNKPKGDRLKPWLYEMKMEQNRKSYKLVSKLMTLIKRFDIYKDFEDHKFMTLCSKFCEFNPNKHKLRFSRLVPDATYIEYQIDLKEDYENLVIYTLSPKNTAFFVEIVQADTILLQLATISNVNGEVTLGIEGLSGPIGIRFRTYFNYDLVRVLEGYNFKWQLMERRHLLYFLK